MNQKIRRYYHFFGSVQGVGFRYKAKYLASGLNLTGWVYNAYDGSVEMEIQGFEASISAMIERLDNDKFIVIEKIEKKEIPLQDWELSFSVRY